MIFKSVLKIILLIFAATTFLKAQDTTDEEGLYPENFEFESDLIGHYSKGWFPTPSPGQTIFYAGGSSAWPNFYIERAHDIRSKSFKNTKYPFTNFDAFTSDEQREFIEPGSKERNDEFPEHETIHYGLAYQRYLPFPGIIRLGAGFDHNNSMLFSNDESREYLDLAGHRQPLKEVSVIAMNEYLLKGSAGFTLPIYGAFLSATEFGGLASYYYLYGGVTGYYALYSSTTQYVQIANAKDELRYANDRDTVQLMNDVRLSELNSFRYAYDVAIGWGGTLGPVTASAEVCAILPQTSILKDANWRQYFAGLRLMIGYTWE